MDLLRFESALSGRRILVTGVELDGIAGDAISCELARRRRALEIRKFMA